MIPYTIFRFLFARRNIISQAMAFGSGAERQGARFFTEGAQLPAHAITAPLKKLSATLPTLFRLFSAARARYLFRMYTIRVSAGFSAAHHLRDYGGKCENQHGHNWRVSACLAGEALGADGMLFDFSELKRLLRGALAELDHVNLNEHPDFTHANPTAENIARWIYSRLAGLLPPGIHLAEVTAEETDGSVAGYSAPLPPQP